MLEFSLSEAVLVLEQANGVSAPSFFRGHRPSDLVLLTGELFDFRRGIISASSSEGHSRGSSSGDVGVDCEIGRSGSLFRVWLARSKKRRRTSGDVGDPGIF